MYNSNTGALGSTQDITLPDDSVLKYFKDSFSMEGSYKLILYNNNAFGNHLLYTISPASFAGQIDGKYVIPEGWSGEKLYYSPDAPSTQ